MTDRLARYKEYLRNLVQINSYTENIEGVADVAAIVFSYFKPYGFRQILIPSKNQNYGDHQYLIRSGGINGTIILVSHLDTVYTEQEEQENNFIFKEEGELTLGPGTCDIKGGTVVALATFEALLEFAPTLVDSFNWIIALNSSEERGVQDFAQNITELVQEEIRAILVFEAEILKRQPRALVNGRKGVGGFDVTVEGISTHAGNGHHRGANAIEALAGITLDLLHLTNYEKGCTVNIGKIYGGGNNNVVPRIAKASFEFRTKDEETFQNLARKIEALNNTEWELINGNKCKVRTEFLDGFYPPWTCNERDNELFDFWKAAASQLGIEVIQEFRGGASDANILSQLAPILDGLGPLGGGAHNPVNSSENPCEYILTKSLSEKSILNSFALIDFMQNLIKKDLV